MTIVVLAMSAACGSTSDEDRAVDALSNGLVSDLSLRPYDISEDEADCFGRYVVDELGADAVLALERDDAGIFEQVQPEQATAFGDGLDACVDNVAEMTRDVLTQNLPTAAEGQAITAEAAECVADDIVGEVSLARLITIGVDNEAGRATRLTAAEATTFANAYVSCTDARAAVLDDVAAQGAEPDEVACFDAQITDADLVERFTAGFLGEPEPDTFAAAAAECF